MKKSIDKKTTVKPIAKKPYHVEVSVNDVKFETDADSLELALTEFVASPVFPRGAKTTAIIKYSKGENEMIRVLRPQEARRTLMAIRLKPSSIAILAEKLERGLE